MKIEHLQVGGFGALTGDFTFSPGLNIVCAPNEAGKTTLSAALMSLLYGIRTVVGKRRQATDDERRYRPFSGGTFALGGGLALRGGLRLNIWRDFGADLCRVVDLASGKDISIDYSRAPNGDILGQKLLGLTRTQYEKIAYIRQDEAARERDFTEFSDTLSALFASEDGQGGTMQQALSALEQALARYDGVSGKGSIRIETELSRLDKRLAEIDQQLRFCEEERQRTEEAFAEVAEQAERSAALEREILQNEYLAGIARLQELQRARSLRGAARENIEKLNLQILELSGFRDFDYSCGEELSTCVTILRDREQKLRENAAQAMQTQASEALLQRRLEELGPLAKADGEVLKRMDIAYARLGEMERRAGSARIDLQSAASALRVEGGEPECAEEYYRWFDALSETDRRFLADYPEKAAAAEKGLALLSTKRAELEKDRLQLEHNRLTVYRQWRVNLFVGMGLFMVAAVAFFYMDLLWFMAIPPVICVAFGVLSLLKMSRANDLDKPAEVRIIREFAELYAREESIDRQRNELAGRLDAVAKLYPDKEERFAAAQEMIVHCRNAIENWRHIRGRTQELTLSSVDLTKEILTLLREFSSPAHAASGLPEANDLPAVLERARRFQLEIKEALSFQQQLAKISVTLYQLQEQRKALEAERVTQRARLEEILLAGGLQASDDPAQGLAVYRENGLRQRRLLELEEQTLPAAIAAAGDESSLHALDADIAALQSRLQAVAQEHPWLQTVRVERSVADYEAMARAARARMQDDGQALAERERAMALGLERYQEQVPALLAEREALLPAQTRAERFQKAIGLAQEVLGGIASDLHARWSPLLAGELAGIVRRFSDRWRFSLSNDLRLGVTPTGGGAPLDEDGLALHLSTGMRDQAYLALRLLLACKLGAGEPLPLILDDPFVNADDVRFREGMEYLREVAREHQIFVFSCHESRHRVLREEMPDIAECFLTLQAQ